jgi:hypothetical protein
MPTTTPSHSDAASLPLAAFRATRYADWRESTFCRWPRAAIAAPLPLIERRRAVARASMWVALNATPHWTIVDTHGQGAAAYRHPSANAAAPLYSPLQCAILEAIRHMRRWRYYADALDATCLPSQPLDGCTCRVCLERAA